VVGHLSAWDFIKGILMEAPLLGNPKDGVFERYAKCKQASLSIGVLLGNLEGVRLPGLLRKKKSISGFLSWTRRPLRF
jgi:hypothetical protein